MKIADGEDERKIFGLKLEQRPERVDEWLKIGDCYPVYIEIGPTNRCNHRCIFCALDWIEHKGIDIDSKVMTRSLKDMAEHNVKSVMFAGEGEPLLHSDIGLFVQTARNSGMNVAITSNGVRFDRKKIEQCLQYLNWIRFSIDSGSAENYARVHRTKPEDFDKLMGNIEEAVKFRNKYDLEAKIEAQFLMIPQNIGEAVKLAGILKNIGVDELQIKPYSHHPNSLNDLCIDSAEYNQVEVSLREFNSDDFKILFRHAAIEGIEEGITYSACYALPFFALVDAAGNIIPCNLFYNNPDFTYGNLYEKSFAEIWTSDKRKEVLERQREKGVGECRVGCRLDAQNKYLHKKHVTIHKKT